ncbi:MAG: molybdenum cofactor guanylyltransferase [Desulfobacterales bacterium]|nr:MAG: molybdenum cofactor guanylyltransferase [Desulfobacterales bacterium]
MKDRVKMRIPCTGVILSGGLATRFHGRDKALMRINGKRILDRIYGVLKDIFDEIILVTNDPLQFLEWDLNIVTDLFDVRSSLTGIHAGLFYAEHPYTFVTACDAPFIKRELIETILAGIEAKTDIVMPETSAGREPLCAVYSKRCLLPAEQHVKQKKLKIQWAFRRCRIKIISEKTLRTKDPDLISFFNINTPQDLERAEQIAKKINR